MRDLLPALAVLIPLGLLWAIHLIDKARDAD